MVRKFVIWLLAGLCWAVPMVIVVRLLGLAVDWRLMVYSIVAILTSDVGDAVFGLD